MRPLSAIEAEFALTPEEIVRRLEAGELSHARVAGPEPAGEYFVRYERDENRFGVAVTGELATRALQWGARNGLQVPPHRGSLH